MHTLSNLIKECKDGVLNNPYQGNDKKVLFVCSMGILRSATASRMYGHKYNTRSAGTLSEALTPITPRLIMWADEVVFVNNENWRRAKQQYATILPQEKVKVLDIPDIYPHMDHQLQKEFKQQYEDV